MLLRFRWAYCQLQELKKLKSTKPKYVKEVLRTLPATLDATYERILTGIGDMYHAEALTLLRWLAFAQRPLSLGELAETTIVDPSGDGTVDFENRGDLVDVLEILSGLVTVEEFDGSKDGEQAFGLDSLIFNRQGDGISGMQRAQRYWRGSKVMLAHFSVKEYLESDRILQSNVSDLHLESIKVQRFLAQSSLVYMLFYTSSNDKFSSGQDFENFPLLHYAARTWFYHSAAQQSGEVDREIMLLRSEEARYDWLLVHQPDVVRDGPFRPLHMQSTGSALYYASFLGLEAVVNELLSTGSNVNAQGGEYCNALQAASARGYTNIVEVLIERGADVNAQGGIYGNPSCLVSSVTHPQRRGMYGNALYFASSRGHQKIVEMLLDNGANVNAQGGYYGNALQAALVEEHMKIVQVLIGRGADVNAQGGSYGSALQAASFRGHEEAVETLIAAGANVNAQGGDYGNALQAASAQGHEKVIKFLINRGANVNAQGGLWGNALYVASARGHHKAAKILKDRVADVIVPTHVRGRNIDVGSFGKLLEIPLPVNEEDIEREAAQISWPELSDAHDILCCIHDDESLST